MKMRLVWSHRANADARRAAMVSAELLRRIRLDLEQVDLDAIEEALAPGDDDAVSNILGTELVLAARRFRQALEAVLASDL